MTSSIDDGNKINLSSKLRPLLLWPAHEGDYGTRFKLGLINDPMLWDTLLLFVRSKKEKKGGGRWKEA